MATNENLPEEIIIPDHQQGDTFPGLRFTITRNGVAKDLTGATIAMTFLLINRRDSEEQVLTAVSGLTIIDGPNGVFDMDQINVVDWKAGEYSYDIEIQYADNEVKTVVEGTWKIVADKTNNS
jgi:hypothetical protein